MQTGGFVDDVHLIVYGKGTEANWKVLKKAHEICYIGRVLMGLFLHPKSTNCFISHAVQRFNMKAMMDLDEVAVNLDTSIRVLGLHIHDKLR